MGGFEPDAKPWLASDEIPEPFEFQLLPEDWDQFDVLMRGAIHRVPVMERTGVKKFYNGPESFTPDHNFIMGQAPQLANYFVAAGFNSSGIAFGGGAGAALARWIVAGEPDLDLSPVDIRRFSPFQGNKRWLRSRVQEIVGLHFAMAWPNREPESSRGVRRSPVHHLLQARRASFGTKQGWERANWFAPPGVTPVTEYGWGRQNWFGPSAAEHRAARETRRPVRPDLVREDRRTRPATPRPPCSGCAPVTWPCRSAGPCTPGCSTTAAGTRPTSP